MVLFGVLKSEQGYMLSLFRERSFYQEEIRLAEHKLKELEIELGKRESERKESVIKEMHFWREKVRGLSKDLSRVESLIKSG